MLLKEVENDKRDDPLSTGWICPNCKTGVSPLEKECPTCKQRNLREDNLNGKQVLID